MQYGLIGERLGHSYSQSIHEQIADYRYELRELAPSELGDFLQKSDFRGINVTIPYKQAVIPYLDELSGPARRIGAVNTVVRRDGRLFGYNTDFAGLCALARHTGVPVQSRKALILGTGGTSKTARAALETLGAAEIFRVSRSAAAPDTVTYEEAARLHGDAQLIVNTTPVGMYPNTAGTPLDLTAFPHLEGVLDAVYNPLRTNLVLDTQARGIPAAGGLYMLAAQAVYASALFLGREPEEAGIAPVWRAVRNEKRNIVLIGMPSAGKTTVGRLLAKRLGRDFYDTDDLILERIGCPIADFMAARGEAAFRDLESAVIEELTRKSGCIVATGGGAVLREQNVRALRRSGVLILLDRAPERLIATPDRPLSSDPEKLARLYEARYPIYRAAADRIADGNGTPEQAAENVKREAEA